ncbi:rhomboid family intramembrane serine protease [Cerasicoccus maritimus]|uniref:rhomboid family intramembrane serine protease n=1 Tax=Cerasicoccus maritimus TaxID=490089 RepID=UPI002852D36C|nr:rhomboid family intramembrane serine protease [Cerasicoccus maritimus]
MGIDGRDYIRERPTGGDGWEFGHAVKWLIILNVIVFVLQVVVVRDSVEADFANSPYGELTSEDMADYMRFAPKMSRVTDWLQLSTDDVLHGQVWRLLTYGFCHDRLSVFHILFNMLFLWWFGKTLERMYGGREFCLFYLVAIILAGVAFVLLDLWTGSRVPSVGASGGVMAVMMLYAMHFPYEKIRIWFLFPIAIRWVVLAYVIFDLHPVLLAIAGDQNFSGVAHAAHVGGLAFGYAYWKLEWRLEPLWEKLPLTKITMKRVLPQRQPKPTLRGKAAPARQRSGKAKQAEQAKIDAILEKISQDGWDSLSAKERKLLDQASESMRGRR